MLANNIDNAFNKLIIGLFAGLYGFTFIPGRDFDIVTHYQIFDRYLNTTFKQFTESLIAYNQPDFALYVIYWVLGHITSNEQIVGFIGSFVFYYLMVLVIDNTFENFFPNKRNPTNFLLILLMFASITVPWTFSGMRNGNAVMVFMYLITLKQKKRITNVFILLLPGLVHFSMFPISVIYLLSNYLNRRFTIFLFFVLILCAPFTFAIVESFYSVFMHMGGVGLFLAKKIDAYIINPTQRGIYFGAGFRFYCVEMPLLFITPFIWLILDKHRQKLNSSEFHLHNFVILFFAYCIFSIRTFLFARDHLVFSYAFIIYLLIYYFSNYINIKSKLPIYLFFVFIIFSIFPSWYFGKEYLCINPDLFYKNLISLLKTKVYFYQYW